MKYKTHANTVQVNLNFTQACGYTSAWTCFTCVKVYNVECILVASMHTRICFTMYYSCICQARVHTKETHEMCGKNMCAHDHENQNA